MIGVSRHGRQALPLLLLLLALASFGGCKRGNEAVVGGRTAHQTAPQVSICTGGTLAVLPLLAHERGDFARQGIGVELIAKGDSQLALSALFDGECDFATSGESTVAMTSFKRNDFVILAEIARAENANRIIARRDLGIRSAGDLRGKVVGVRRNSMSHFFLDLFLKKHGLGDGAVTVHFMEPGMQFDALERGEIAAYSGTDELVLQGMRKLGDRAVVFSEPELCLNSTCLLVRRDFVESNRALVNKVLRAMLAAEEFADSRPEEVWDIVARSRGMAKSDVQAMCQHQTQLVALRQSLLLTLEDRARWMMEAGLAAKGPLPNLLDLLEPGPLKILKPSAVSLNR